MCERQLAPMSPLHVKITNLLLVMQKHCLRMHSMQVYTQQANRWEMDSQAVRNGTAKWMKRWQKFFNGWMADGNFWTDVVKWMSGWKKFLNGRNRTDEQLKKNNSKLYNWLYPVNGLLVLGLFKKILLTLLMFYSAGLQIFGSHTCRIHQYWSWSSYQLL